MSNISTAYDALVTLITATFPNHVELINPYVPELNDDLTFEKGWGMALSQGSNTNRVVGCEISVERDLVITLTKKIFIGGINRTTDSVSARRAAEKDLFEDQFLLIKTLEKAPTVNDSTPIIKTIYVSDGGLEFVRTERTDLIMVKSIFSIGYHEDLNA